MDKHDILQAKDNKKKCVLKLNKESYVEDAKHI